VERMNPLRGLTWVGWRAVVPLRKTSFVASDVEADPMTGDSGVCVEGGLTTSTTQRPGSAHAVVLQDYQQVVSATEEEDDEEEEEEGEGKATAARWPQTGCRAAASRVRWSPSLIAPMPSQLCIVGKFNKQGVALGPWVHCHLGSVGLSPSVRRY
jgi:hypothetical protein